jgi:hypothetical protein
MLMAEKVEYCNISTVFMISKFVSIIFEHQDSMTEMYNSKEQISKLLCTPNWSMFFHSFPTVTPW